MPQLTKAQLAAELEHVRVYNQRLECELASLRTQRVATTRPRAEPQVLSAYRQACAQARELAMRIGRSVKVTQEA